MTFPAAPANYQQERLGITAVAYELAKLGLIWRETSTGDVGIDGQIEYVDRDGCATGQLVAVQVKAGPSYFKDGGDVWHYYPADKHRFYWERFPIPVILMLHEPSEAKTYWVDARQVLRSPSTSAARSIDVPKAQVMNKLPREALFSGTGVSGRSFLPLEDVLRTLIITRSQNNSFPITYFDLFANGLTNICRSLFFGMDLACTIAQSKLSEGFGMGMGHDEHQFLFSYTEFIVEQHIADIPFSDCLIDWYDRDVQPTWLAGLTSRGRSLVELVGSKQDAFVRDARLKSQEYLRVAQEDTIQMVWSPSHFQRLELIREFQKVVLAAQPASLNKVPTTF